jgi:PhnB protein
MSLVLSPYLNFQGNCEAAMKFYQDIFGGDLEISRFSDFPHTPAGHENGVMHATLTSSDITFMASDGMPGGTVNFGDSVNMSLSGDDEEKMTKFFNGLSESGKLTMPLAKQAWGDLFGMLTDKFGINWLVNITAK